MFVFFFLFRRIVYLFESVSVNGGRELRFFRGTDTQMHRVAKRCEEDMFQSCFLFFSCMYVYQRISRLGYAFSSCLHLLHRWLPDHPLAVLTNLACLVPFSSSWIAPCLCAEGFDAW